MTTLEKLVEEVIFKRHESSIRFLDSPVYPDVSMRYARHADDLEKFRADLILTAHLKSSASELFQQLVTRLKEQNKYHGENHQIACAGDTVVAKLTIKELVNVVLPMTKWWQQYLWKHGKPGPDMKWFLELLRTIHGSDYSKLRKASETIPIMLWSVSRNRPASVTVEKSIPATKADACRRVFDIDGTGIIWAIIDTGIDARHSAFRKKDEKKGKQESVALGPANHPKSNHTRVIATYDFTRFREVLVEIYQTESLQKKKNNRRFSTGDSNDQGLSDRQIESYVSEIKKSLEAGRSIDWTTITSENST